HVRLLRSRQEADRAFGRRRQRADSGVGVADPVRRGAADLGRHDHGRHLRHRGHRPRAAARVRGGGHRRAAAAVRRRRPARPAERARSAAVRRADPAVHHRGVGAGRDDDSGALDRLRPGLGGAGRADRRPVRPRPPRARGVGRGRADITIRSRYGSLTNGNTLPRRRLLGLWNWVGARVGPRSFTARSNMSVFTRGSPQRSRTAGILGAVAIAGASALVLAGCSGGGGTTPTTEAPEARDLTLSVGTVLPQTGALAYLGPPEEAGVGLATAEVNEAAKGITIDV